MTELNFLNSLPKEFSREINTYKFLISILVEFKQEMLFSKNIAELENKTIEQLGKNIPNSTKNYTQELLVNNLLQEDVTNIVKVNQNIMNHFEASSKFLEEFSQVQFITKLFNDVYDDIGYYIKQTQDGLTNCTKELSNVKAKYKTNLQKCEKLFKDVDTSLQAKRKNESDEKATYNLALKDKMDDKVLNLLNEFEENHSSLISTFDDYKKIEETLNEFTKNNFNCNIKLTDSLLVRISQNIQIAMDQKFNIMNIIKSLTTDILNTLTNLDVDLNEEEQRYCEMKGIKFEPLSSINIEDQFNRNNFLSSNVNETILINLNILTTCLGIKKKAFAAFIKSLNEITKQIDSFSLNASKLIKSLVTPKISVLAPCLFLIQFKEFTKSTFELVARKLEEYSKNIVSQLITPTDAYSKDINTDEASYTNLMNKFQKEYLNYKSIIQKLNATKDKINQNIEKVKESIIKTSDDPNNFSKYESKLLGLRNEEEQNNEALNNAYKTYRKYLDEFFDNFKKTNKGIKDKEISKVTEIKENCLSVIKTQEKIFSQIIEFLDFKSQIINTDEACFTALTSIYQPLTVEANENNPFTEDLIKNITTNAHNNLIYDMTNLYLLNKDEVINLKEFNLLDIFKEEELNFYKEKLNFLKTNQMKISIKNVNKKKQFDGVFFIDEDEIVKTSYACALSDKILLQGKLYLTTKKLVFYSWFNNSTLFGKTLIEIPKEDIISYNKKGNIVFDNEIVIKTKNMTFNLASFMNRDKCILDMKEIYIEANLNSTEIVDISNELSLNDSKEKPKSCNLLPVDFEEPVLKKERSLSIIESESPKRLREESKREIERPDNIDAGGLMKDRLKDRLSETALLSKLNEINVNRLNTYDTANKRNFLASFITNKIVGDLPLPFIFNACYDPNAPCPELGKPEKSFIINYLEIPQNYNIVLTKVDEESWTSKIPNYYINKENCVNYFTNTESINKLLSDFENPDYSQIEFKFNYTHPILKKKFMGPSKLDVLDHFKIYFISPLCFIVEIFSHMSGFMMMDTFYTVLRYKFDTQIVYDEITDSLKYNTLMNANFTVEFVKDNWFKNKVIDNSLIDVKEFIDTVMISCFDKVFNGNKVIYKELQANEFRIRVRQLSDVSNLEEPKQIIKLPEINTEATEDVNIELILIENSPKVKPEIFLKKVSEDKPLDKEEVRESVESILFNYLDMIVELLQQMDQRVLVAVCVVFVTLVLKICDYQILFILLINVIGLLLIYKKLSQINQRLSLFENKVKQL
jgi:hypothetical protein